MEEPTRQIRFELFQFLLNNCRPPTVDELVTTTGYDASEITRSLHQLEDLHHIKLYSPDVPSITPVAMAHPFSHLPTPNVVRQGSKSWWANCAWCAFGLAAMLQPNECSVHVLLSSGEHRAFTFANNELEKTTEDNFITFSPPPSRWWVDVRFACSAIQVCESKDAAEAWFAEHGFSRGDVVDSETLWRLSKAWYGNKHHFDYERKTPEEAKALFTELGMVSEYWTS